MGAVSPVHSLICAVIPFVMHYVRKFSFIEISVSLRDSWNGHSGIHAPLKSKVYSDASAFIASQQREEL